MPGIVGLISKMPRAQAEAKLAKMVEALRHESFYVTGTWTDESMGVYVGWIARKNSFCDAMPLHNETGDVTLIFAGEEYPDQETRRHLKVRGHAIEVDGPSYLVHWYEEDPNFLHGLNGRFHGLLVDKRRGVATLFNDRYGMQRIYYQEANDGFYFAAEAKAILAVSPAPRQADLQSLGELVSCGCILEDRTPFQGVRGLPSGSAWQFSNGALRQKDTYFHPKQWEDQEALEPETYYAELRQAFARNIPRYFAGPERLGVSLTGGLDTRVIMAWWKAQPGTLPCYTFGGMFRDCEDVTLARRVAAVCGQTHEVIPVGDEFLSNFSSYAERSVYLTEGGVDVYRSSDLYVSEKARHIAPAKIVGTYGSEIIRRAVMFKPQNPMQRLYHPAFLSHVRHAAETYALVCRRHPVTFAAFQQSPWYHFGILALEQSQLTVRSPYLDNDIVRTVYRAPKTASLGDDERLRLIRDGSSDLARIRTDRGIGGDSNPIAAAMLNLFLEFTFKAEYAYDYGMPQWMSRTDHTFSILHLQKLFLGRHKMLHFRVWYRDWLAGYVRHVLLDPVALSRPHIERKGLEKIVQGHLNGGLNYTSAIHRLLTLELLHRLFFDSK